jgi:hypothetical protein
VRRAFAILTLTLAASGCDDAPLQGPPEEAADGGADSSAPVTIDASFDASSLLDAQLDAGFVAEPDAAPDARDAAALPYVREVVSYQPGSNAGYGQEKYPGVVLGPPSGKGNSAGALDVLSLGVGGSVVLDFGARAVVDGPGPDFIVFENAFFAGGVSQAAVFAELGEVSVSNDLTTWLTFPCSLQSTQPGVFPGCAGWTPTQQYDPFAVVPLVASVTGGDVFDLATVSTASARYVRVRDLATRGEGSNAGFDLDAIGIINAGAVP